jgi:hypothetical protein
MRKLWRMFLARFRLDLQAVCEESKGKGPHSDYHDYPDDEFAVPMHFALMKCVRCGKEFYI